MRDYVFDGGAVIGAHVPSELKRELAALAFEHRRSLSAEARLAFERYIRESRDESAPESLKAVAVS